MRKCLFNTYILHPLQFYPALFFSQCLLCFCSSPVEGTANSDWKLWRIMLPLHSLLAASQIWILRGIIHDSFAFEILNSVPDLLDEKDPNENENQSMLVEERQNNIHVYYIVLLEYYKWHLNMHMGISVAAQMKQQRNLSVANRAYSWMLV